MAIGLYHAATNILKQLVLPIGAITSPIKYDEDIDVASASDALRR
jgi:hypothetical protein